MTAKITSIIHEVSRTEIVSGGRQETVSQAAKFEHPDSKVRKHFLLNSSCLLMCMV